MSDQFVLFFISLGNFRRNRESTDMIHNADFQKNLTLLSMKELFFAPDSLHPATDSDVSVEQEDNVCNLEDITSKQIILLTNEQNLQKIMEIERRNDPYLGRMNGKANIPMLPLYLYYDETPFSSFMTKENLRSLYEHYRIVIIVGMKAFREFFMEMASLLPSLVLGNKEQEITLELQYIQQQKNIILNKMIEDVLVYYKQEENNIKKRIADKTPRVCVLKNSYEPPRFQGLYQQMKDSLERAGCQVNIVNERGPVFQTTEFVNIYHYRPDIIFQINKSRNGRTYLGHPLNLEHLPQLFYINWVQDIHPAVLNQEYARTLGDNDYIFTLFDKHVMERYGFEHKHVIYGGIMPADRKHFHTHAISPAEHERYDCDICFVGSIMTDAAVANFIYQSLKSHLTEDKINLVADSLFTMLERIYDSNTGKYHITAEALDENVSRLQEELELNDEARLNVYRVFSVVRYNSLRKLILLQLAATGKYKITLYSANDINIPGVNYGGFLDDPVELSKAMQCSKIIMQINPDATMNQRVAEGLLSHTMILVFDIMGQSDMSSIHPYLQAEEGICYFQTKQELLMQCDFLLEDDAKREEVAEKGYRKASELLSTDAVFTGLLEKLRQKLN